MARKRSASDITKLGEDAIRKVVEDLHPGLTGMTTSEYRRINNIIGKDIHIHHIVAHSLGGPDMPINYMNLSAEENMAIGNSVWASFKKNPKVYAKVVGIAMISPQRGVKRGGVLKLVAGKAESESRGVLKIIAAIAALFILALVAKGKQ